MTETYPIPFFPAVTLLSVLIGAAFYLIFRETILIYIRKLKSSRQNNYEERVPLLHEAAQIVELTSPELSMKTIPWSNVLTLFVNGKEKKLVNPNPSDLLVTFIRETEGLKGTKTGCEEGGCGACTVVLTKPEGTVSINSCLRPLCANDGMAVTTVEGIGSVSSGMSEEQKRLVANNGTQCGYCTPGWISNMHALNKSNEETGSVSTKKEIEAYLDGNICRCTGYRPIVQAFHSFADESYARGGTTNKNTIDYSKNPMCIEKQCTPAKQVTCKAAGLCCSSESDVEDAHKVLSGGSLCSGGTKSSSSSHVVVAKASSRDLALVRSYTPQPLMFYNPVSGQRWIRPVSLAQLCAVLRELKDTEGQAVQLVGGNTSIGVTKYLNGTSPYNAADEYTSFVDVNCVSVMTAQSYNDTTGVLTVGAANTLSTVITLLKQHQAGGEVQPNSAAGTQACSEGYSGDMVNHHSVFSVTANHLSHVANTQVRNAGTWAGNLIMFLRYSSFPSDVVLALTTANAHLQLCDMHGALSVITMDTFLSSTISEFESKGVMIVSLLIKESVQHRPFNPSMNVPHGNGTMSVVGREFITETFKIAQRARNAHAHVNAGFQFELSRMGAGSPPVCSYARVVFGGVSKKTFIAQQTQLVLINAPVTSQTLQSALQALASDLQTVGKSEAALSNQAFRESVMQSCLYRALLRCYNMMELPASLTSAVLPWVKPTSRGVEVFVPPTGAVGEQSKPIGRPVRKLEAPIQATGEAKYPSDETMPPQGLYGVIVYSTQCAVTLDGINTAAALAISGVESVMTAVDIPGNNEGKAGEYLFVPVGEIVPCVGAPLAVVVASTEAVANQAAAAVGVAYSSTGTAPVVNITQAIEKQSFYDRVPRFYTDITRGDPDTAMSQSTYTVSGRISAAGQYHFYMEAQAATATVEDGDAVNVVCGTQDPSGYQAQISAMLGVQQNKVVVNSPRAGGAFGGKITSGIPVSAAAALCASKLRRSVRIFNTRTADMNMQGGREEWLADYTVGFSADGKITALKYQFYVDAGVAKGDTLGALYMGMNWADSAYYFPNYSATSKVCYTNTPSRTSMRAPGVVQACFCTESVVERVATELGLPAATVQQRNFISDGDMSICGQVITDCTLPTVWSTLMQRSRYSERLDRATSYNNANMWRKRGVSICPVKYGMGWAGYNAGIRLGVRSSDGTVIVAHSGAEIGQGINTKAAQAVAMALGIDLSLVRVTSAGTDKVVNGGVTGGSGTSEVIVQAALNACATLNARLDPYRSTAALKSVTGSSMTPHVVNPSLATRSGTAAAVKKQSQATSDWIALLSTLPSDVSLNVEGWYSPPENPNKQPFQYFVYAACVTELELDVLTGETHVLASEIVYDCGQSLNPSVDIGQIEGALVMGLGYFLTEQVEYNSTTGQLLSEGTWEYKPPMVADIPSVLNVTLLKNMYNESGILGSKAVGEPPYVIANSVYFALKMAVTSARKDAGVTGFFDLDVPATVDQRQLASLVDSSRFIMPY